MVGLLRHSDRKMRLLAAVILAALSAPVVAQSYPAGRDANPGPMLNEGLTSYRTPQLRLRLVKSSGTVAGIETIGNKVFDFVPVELLAARSVDGYYHLGDLDLRLREAGSQEWKGYSTALERWPVKQLPTSPGELRRDDLRPTLPTNFPLEVTRSWAVVDGKLALRFMLRNPGTKPVEIGALGIPLIFDNILSGKNLDEAHAICSFSDPSIALDGGYVQVTRLNGHGPAMVVIPDGKTPFEAYNLIDDEHGRGHQAELFHDLTPRSLTFEGFYEWMVASSAYQQNEWKNAVPWNPATSIVLEPGQQRTVGLRFLVADSIEAIEKALAAAHSLWPWAFPGTYCRRISTQLSSWTIRSQ